MRRLRSKQKGLLSNPFAVVMVLVSMLFITAVTYAFYGERGTANQLRNNTLASPHSVAYQRVENQRVLLDTATGSDDEPDWVSLLSRSAIPGTNGVAGGVFAERAGDDTLTGGVARELFGSFMRTFSQTGISFDGVDPEKMAKDALTKSVAKKIRVPNFSVTELSTTPADVASFKRYLNEMEPILSGLAYGPNELAIMQALTTETTKATQELVDAVVYYEQYVSAMKAVAVPNDKALVAHHAQVVDASQKYLYALSMLAEMKEDPALAALGVELYMAHSGRLSLALEEYGIILMDIAEIIR